jgi:electron transfer flavoprotein beta subunit
MKLLVCICQTPDTTAKIEFTDGNTKFNTAGVQYILNPTDEWYALVRAIELKEQLGGSVTVVTVGKADTEQNIRKALAIGADDAVRIDADPQDAYLVGAQIAQYAKGQGYDLIFTGKETIDYNGFSVPGIVAELLDLPHVSLAAHLSMNGNTATIDREIEGGVERVEVQTPFLVSAQKGMAEQRIASMKGIMSSRTKPLQVVAPAAIAPLTHISSYELPAKRQSVKLIDPENAGDLIRLLHEEAKVI